jgi:5-methylcytosine-specific restriction protein B
VEDEEEEEQDADIEKPPEVTLESAFSAETFKLLEALYETPTRAFYNEHKQEFKEHLEQPFQDLLRQVAERLPLTITDVIETEKRIFSRFPKNDYGRGGAWDYYWGAFYPKGGRRTHDAQLFAWMNYERLEFGFYIGEYGSEQRKRFVRNCKENREAVVNVFRESLADDLFVYGRREDFVGGPPDKSTKKRKLSWNQWLENPEQEGIHAAVVLPKDQVLQSSTETLIDQITKTFERLFPLVLLATSDDPLPAIGEYMEIEEEEVEHNPEYPLAQIAEETGFDKEMLDSWVRAIERKRQAIIYGPPGTGKTYIAELLARHLIGGNDGFMDIVQFHPAFAYEDFMQGIRPKPRPEGGLDYPMIKGRFLEFCEEARTRKGLSVLILDEINRANLARVFGELMYLLEYRDKDIPLAGGGRFKIPKNVRIIGTMNTADRSIALVDHALRRRFAFSQI